MATRPRAGSGLRGKRAAPTRSKRPRPAPDGAPSRQDAPRSARNPSRHGATLPAIDGLITSRELRVDVARVGAARASRSDLVAVEEPLEIRIDGQPLGVTMRTPGHDEELAAGLLLAEGVIRGPADIGSIAVCRNPANLEERNVVTVYLRHGLTPDWKRLRRTMLTSSSCGLCGKASIDALRTRAKAVPRGRARVREGVLVSLPAALRAGQEVFAATGGLHAAGLFRFDGTLELLREDVGRHNAVDKVVGASVLAGRVPAGDRILLVSGRASYEIVQKAVVARLPVVAAVSAPSSLAVGLAKAMGVTLVGFLRGEGFNVYSHPWRVAPAPSTQKTTQKTK